MVHQETQLFTLIATATRRKSLSDANAVKRKVACSACLTVAERVCEGRLLRERRSSWSRASLENVCMITCEVC